MQDDVNEYLTEREACEYLKVSRTTLFKYVKRNLLRKYEQTAPRQILYRKSELENLKRIKPKE
jgi:excisionase family DNA binding protein